MRWFSLKTMLALTAGMLLGTSACAETIFAEQDFTIVVEEVSCAGAGGSPSGANCLFSGGSCPSGWSRNYQDQYSYVPGSCPFYLGPWDCRNGRVSYFSSPRRGIPIGGRCRTDGYMNLTCPSRQVLSRVGCSRN